MTDAFWTALAPIIVSIGGLVAALAAWRASVRNSAKSDVIIEKAVEIHTLTNSNLSKVTAALETANSKINGLERLVATMVESTAATSKAADAAGVATEARASEAAAVAAAAAASTPFHEGGT